jgi:hypothetical protein
MAEESPALSQTATLIAQKMRKGSAGQAGLLVWDAVKAGLFADPQFFELRGLMPSERPKGYKGDELFIEAVRILSGIFGAGIPGGFQGKFPPYDYAGFCQQNIGPLADLIEKRGRPYTFGELLVDLRTLEGTRSLSEQYAKKAGNSDSLDVRTPGGYLVRVACEYGQQQQEQAIAIFAREGVDRLKTIVSAKGKPFDADAIEHLCAEASLRSGKTLAEFLQMDIVSGAGLLLAEADQPNKSEGTGRAVAAPEQPAIASDDARKAALLALEPADQRAYYTYAYAEMKLGTTTDRQAHQWLSDNGLPDEKDSPELAKALGNYKLPTLATWSKQLRNARLALREQKHTRRAGRSPGGSVVPASDLDSQTDAD